MALVWVVVVLAGVVAAALAGYVALKVAWRVLFPAAGRTIRFVWQRPALRWAAIIIPVLLVMIVAGAALLMPAVHFALEEASSTRDYRNFYNVGSALRAYETKHGNYPDSPDALVEEGLIGREVLDNDEVANFDYRAGGKKAADLPADAVVAYAETEGGFSVLYNDGRVERKGRGEMRDLAAQLYKQGDVDANVVREDLKLDEEVNESAKQYDEAKRLKGRSRANLDQLVGKDIRDRIQQKVEERYGREAEWARATGRAEAEAGEGQQAASKEALEAQTNKLLAQAQDKAGVEVTVAAPKPSAAPPAPAEAPAGPPPVEPPAGPVTAEPEKPADLWKTWAPEDTGAVVFGKVEQGRSKGSLPIGLELPEVSRAPYLFGSVFTGSGLGKFELTAARAGTGYTSYSIAGAAVVGLVLVAGRLGWAWKKNCGAKAHA
jgi:hypothetical protein